MPQFHAEITATAFDFWHVVNWTFWKDGVAHHDQGLETGIDCRKGGQTKHRQDHINWKENTLQIHQIFNQTIAYVFGNKTAKIIVLYQS